MDRIRGDGRGEVVQGYNKEGKRTMAKDQVAWNARGMEICM